jgi:hypothetical protein
VKRDLRSSGTLSCVNCQKSANPIVSYDCRYRSDYVRVRCDVISWEKMWSVSNSEHWGRRWPRTLLHRHVMSWRTMQWIIIKWAENVVRRGWEEIYTKLCWKTYASRPPVIALLQDQWRALIMRNNLENPEIESGVVDLICWCDVTTANRGTELAERFRNRMRRTNLNKWWAAHVTGMEMSPKFGGERDCAQNIWKGH